MMIVHRRNPLASNRRNRSISVVFETTTTPLDTPGASTAPSTTQSQSDIDTPDIDDLQNHPDSQPPNTLRLAKSAQHL